MFIVYIYQYLYTCYNRKKINTYLKSTLFKNLFSIFKAINCPKPHLPDSVIINPDKPEYAYRDTVRFGCRTGFTFNGNVEKTCLQSEDLMKDIPTCTGNTYIFYEAI